MLINEKAVDKLKAGAKLRQITDDKLKGFGVRVQPNGRKTFFWSARVNAKLRFKFLGEHPTVPLKNARAAAKEWNERAATWKAAGFPEPDPFTKAVQVGTGGPETFRQLFEAYIHGQVRPTANHPEKAEEELRWKLHDHFAAWLDRPATSITTDDVIAVREACGKKHVLANRAVQLVRAIYNWGAKSTDGKVNFGVMANPAMSVVLYPEKPRERFLQPDELVRFEAALKTTESRDLRDFLALALATGARKSDVLGMRWQDIQFERKIWHVHDTKIEAYNATLEAPQIAILTRRRKEVPDSSPWVFPSHGRTGHIVTIKKAWQSFLKRAKISNFRIHDIRHTTGSWQAISGVPLLTIGKTLGHKSAASTKRYAHLLDEAVREGKAASTAKMKEMMDAARKRAKSAKA